MAIAGAMFRRTFASLGVRNYRLYFIGQVVSVTGTWMQSTAQMWLVLHLTGSALALGLTTALQFAPMLVLGIWGGVLADRVDKRRLLYVTQSAAGLLAAGLAVLTFSGRIELWMVYGFAVALGLVTAIDNPARQSFVIEMVGPGQVSNAVSLNSTVFTGARVVGPALSGLVIALYGTAWCFAFNAVSYIAVIIALALIRSEGFQRSRPLARAPGQVVDGLRHALGRPELRTPLLVLLVIGTFSFNFSVLLPLIARNTFHGDARTYGLLFSVMGLGSLAGALVSASRQRPTQRLIVGSAVAFGALLLVAASAPTLLLEMAVLIPLGAAMITFQATTNAWLQMNTDGAFRGRVMALYMVAFVGSTPIGGPLIGFVAQQLGPRFALGVGGAAALIAGGMGALLFRRTRSRKAKEVPRVFPVPELDRPL
ncbi:MAG TPA: MFS transporter [Candidatus Dormibacteraeota bacterium]|jgi:MFS family permease